MRMAGMNIEFRQAVLCNQLPIAQACRTVDWALPVPRAGEYVAGLDFLSGAQELPVQRVLLHAQKALCCIELPPFSITQLRISYRELERTAVQKGWQLQKV